MRRAWLALKGDCIGHRLGKHHLAAELAAIFQRSALCRCVAILAAVAKLVVMMVMMCVMHLRVVMVVHLRRGMAARMGDGAERREGHGHSYPKQKQNASHVVPHRREAPTLPRASGRVKARLLERSFW